ncbi:chitin deacetylase [Phlyctochytrium bullatum]|nr:chitin deacetylase [Phlyctochytrium bullatum]
MDFGAHVLARAAMRLSLAAVVVGALELVPGAAAQWDLSGYPAYSVPPPINPEWTAFYLGNAQIPNIPVRRSPNPEPDYTYTIKTCSFPGMWAQTFDDGPSPASETLMDVLKDRGFKTSFFNIGTNVVKYPCAMVRKEVEGHVNCLHTWSHSALTTLTNDQIVAEIVWNAIAVKQATGKAPKCFRPPYGDVDARVIAILNAMGLTTIWVNMDTNDWQMEKGMTAAEVLSTVNTAIRDSSTTESIISLSHDLYPDVVEVGIQSFNSILLANKFRLATIEECLGVTGLDDGLVLPPSAVVPPKGTC